MIPVFSVVHETKALLVAAGFKEIREDDYDSWRVKPLEKVEK